MCIVQHVEIKSVFTFQPIKRLVSRSVKTKTKARCNVFNIPFKDQKWTIVFWR